MFCLHLYMINNIIISSNCLFYLVIYFIKLFDFSIAVHPVIFKSVICVNKISERKSN